jgi:hypothetical protein
MLEMYVRYRLIESAGKETLYFALKHPIISSMEHGISKNLGFIMPF